MDRSLDENTMNSLHLLRGVLPSVESAAPECRFGAIVSGYRQISNILDTASPAETLHEEAVSIAVLAREGASTFRKLHNFQHCMIRMAWGSPDLESQLDRVQSQLVEAGSSAEQKVREYCHMMETPELKAALMSHDMNSRVSSSYYKPPTHVKVGRIGRLAKWQKSASVGTPQLLVSKRPREDYGDEMLNPMSGSGSS